MQKISIREEKNILKGLKIKYFHFTIIINRADLKTM